MNKIDRENRFTQVDTLNTDSIVDNIMWEIKEEQDKFILQTITKYVSTSGEYTNLFPEQYISKDRIKDLIIKGLKYEKEHSED